MNGLEVYLIEQLDTIKMAMMSTAILVALGGLLLMGMAITLKVKKIGEDDQIEIGIKLFAWGIIIALAMMAVNSLLPTSKAMARIAIVPKVVTGLYMTEDKSADDFAQEYLTKEAYKERR